MAGAGIEVQFVKFLQLANAFERRRAEWSFSVESMQHNAFQNVSQRHVVVLSESLKDFQDAFLDAHASLYPLNFQPGIVCHVYQCTTVHKRKTRKDGFAY